MPAPDYPPPFSVCELLEIKDHILFKYVFHLEPKTNSFSSKCLWTCTIYTRWISLLGLHKQRTTNCVTSPTETYCLTFLESERAMAESVPGEAVAGRGESVSCLSPGFWKFAIYLCCFAAGRCTTPSVLCPHLPVAFPPCACPCVQIAPFSKDTRHISTGPTYT